MHRALQIEEILLNIFDHCHTVVQRHWLASSVSWQCRNTDVELAVLARTCKTFKEPALNIMWAELGDLSPLVRCLFEDSWTVSRQKDGYQLYSFTKLLEEIECDTIVGYARRIRALPCLHNSSGLTEDCIKTLSKITSQSMFPNLRVVRLRSPSMIIAPLVRHFAGSNVTCLTLLDAESLGTVIDAFAGCSVTDLEVAGWDNTDTISALLCNWRNLHAVDCHETGLNADALSHLSRLHGLRCMSFEAHDRVADLLDAAQSLVTTLTFPSLDSLSLNSSYLTPTWRLLRHFRLPVIRRIQVSLHFRPTVLDFMSFFATLCEICDYSSLDNLYLVARSRKQSAIDHKVPTNHDPSPYCITFDNLSPLMVFTNIRHVKLSITACGIDLSERELLTLASSWPYLETFDVGRDCVPARGITPRGFLQLMEGCRSLRVLYFPFDVRGYTEVPRGHPWRGLSMPRHASISVLASPIEEASVEALSVFFHVAPHPDFTMTTCWSNDFVGWSEQIPRKLWSSYSDRWRRVFRRSQGLSTRMKEIRLALEA